MLQHSKLISYHRSYKLNYTNKQTPRSTLLVPLVANYKVRLTFWQKKSSYEFRFVTDTRNIIKQQKHSFCLHIWNILKNNKTALRQRSYGLESYLKLKRYLYTTLTSRDSKTLDSQCKNVNLVYCLSDAMPFDGIHISSQNILSVDLLDLGLNAQLDLRTCH